MNEEKKTLNLDTFNEILYGALKDQSPQGKLELLEAEFNMIAGLFMDKCGDLLDELNEKGYESDLFTQIKNIKANSEGLLEEYEYLQEQIELEKIDKEQQDG